MSHGNGRHNPPQPQFDPQSRTPSTRTASSSGESAPKSASPRSPQHSRNPSKPSAIRGFFAVREPSAAALEKMAKQQRIDMAKRGLQYPSGVTTGQLSSKQADADLKRQEAAAKRTAKMYEQKRQENRKLSYEPQPVYQPEPITYHTLDPAFQPGSAYTTTASPSSPYAYSPQSRPTHTPESPRHMKLPSLDSIPEGNPTVYHGRSTSSASNSSWSHTPPRKSFGSSSGSIVSSEVQRKLAAPWEIDEKEVPPPKKKGILGYGRR